MKTYTVKKGKKNFRPIESPLPIWKPKGFELTAKIHPGGWSSLQDWEYDKDWYDWQKLKGLTTFFSRNNSNSAMIAFRFAEQPETYEIAAYTNYPKTKFHFDFDKTIIVDAGEWFTASSQLVDNQAKYTLNYNEKFVFDNHGFAKKMNIAREVGTYAAGANNSPGKHGGRAFKNMSIDIDFQIIK